MTLVRAKQSFMAGARRIVHSGDLVDAADPIIKGREALFEAVEAAARNEPAGPGSTLRKAARTAPAKKAAAEPAAPAKKAPAKKAPAKTAAAKTAAAEPAAS